MRKYEGYAEIGLLRFLLNAFNDASLGDLEPACSIEKVTG